MWTEVRVFPPLWLRRRSGSSPRQAYLDELRRKEDVEGVSALVGSILRSCASSFAPWGDGLDPVPGCSDAYLNNPMSTFFNWDGMPSPDYVAEVSVGDVVLERPGHALLLQALAAHEFENMRQQGTNDKGVFGLRLQFGLRWLRLRPSNAPNTSSLSGPGSWEEPGDTHRKRA